MQKSTSSKNNRLNSFSGDELSNHSDGKRHRPNRNLFQTLDTPVKSVSDKKDYKVIRLQNGLTVCLISDTRIEGLLNQLSDASSGSESESDAGTGYSTDEDAPVDQPGMPESSTSSDEGDDAKPAKVRSEEQKMAAAALCVSVGSFSDPKDIPGMAHFLEHMVFMGSTKYPEENDFDSFIKTRGGSDNASTDSETTTFYFECLEKDLLKGLDKFSQFFISPLMKKESIKREREAIDSEFQTALPSDTYRKEQLLVSLSRQTGPVNSFPWGNLETLRDNIDDAVLYEQLHRFRKQHYSAHRMTVAIQARLPMDVLESYVVECFSDVPSNNLPGDDFSMYDKNVFDTPSFRRLYYVKPTKDISQVELTWVLPSLLDMYKSKPQAYVSWLMGHEGKGSLLSYLREKVWVLDIYTGNAESGTEHNRMYALFSVTMVLTQEGLTKLPEVIEAVFSYIRLLKDIGPQERIFKEIQTIQETSFRFSEEESAVDLVERLVESMHYYPPKDYLAGAELYFEYDPEAIKMVLDHLVPDKLNIMVLDKLHLPPNQTHSKTERWFKTPYIDVDVPADWFELWAKARPKREFSMPQPNFYLTEDFSILPPEPDNPAYPEQIISTDILELWYRKDQTFKLPTAYYYFYFITPLATNCYMSSCMLDLYVTLLNIHLTEEAYPAVLADLSYNISVKERGVVVKVDGYNQKLPILLQLISSHFADMSTNLKANIFEALKDKVKKAYYNKFLKPSKLSTDLRLNVLIEPYFIATEKYDVVRTVTFEMIKEFSASFLNNLYIKGLIQGNVDKNTAVKTTHNFIKRLNYAPLTADLYPRFKVVELPPGVQYCRVKSFNRNDSNSIVTNYYQVGSFSVKRSVIIEMLLLLIDEPLFDILRTKEQLGYNVFSTLRETFGILGFSITVNAQAAKNSTDHVDARIEAFISHAEKLLKRTSSKDLGLIKSDLIKVKSCCDVLLDDEVVRNWGEIVTADYMFDRPNVEIEAIKKITVADLKNFWKRYTFCDKAKGSCSKLSVQVAGYDTSERSESEDMEKESEGNDRSAADRGYQLHFVSGDASDKNASVIMNINEFKQKCNFFPNSK